MHWFWYNCVKGKYREKKNYVTWKQTVLFCTIETDDIYRDIAECVETRFDSLNYELVR